MCIYIFICYLLYTFVYYTREEIKISFYPKIELDAYNSLTSMYVFDTRVIEFSNLIRANWSTTVTKGTAIKWPEMKWTENGFRRDWLPLNLLVHAPFCGGEKSPQRQRVLPSRGSAMHVVFWIPAQSDSNLHSRAFPTEIEQQTKSLRPKEKESFNNWRTRKRLSSFIENC